MGTTFGYQVPRELRHTGLTCGSLGCAATLLLMAAHPWPDIPDEQRWSLELMEERLEQTTQPPRELSARAEELRAQAAQTDIEGYRDAALALADRYEQAAAARLALA